MCVIEDRSFIEWLIRKEPFKGAIEIPEICVEHKCIIESSFDDNLNWNDYANRVIICPTNDDTLTLNDKVLAMLPGDERIYYSADYIECNNDPVSDRILT